MENNELFIIKDGDLIGINPIFNIPQGIKSLEYGYFYNCDFIEEINIPSSCEKIDDHIFDFLKHLKRINVDPQNKHYISIDGCLYTKDKKKLIKYPNNKECNIFYVDEATEIIGRGAFCEATSLENLCLSKNTKIIESNSVGEPSKVFIPSTDALIENYAFKFYDSYYGTVIGCEKGSSAEKFCLKNDIPFLYVNNENLDWFFSLSFDEHYKLIKEKTENETEFIEDFSENGFIASYKNNTLTISATTEKNEVTVSNLNEKISSFRRTNIKNIVIDKGITHIAENAFRDYYNLESIVIGKDLCHIDQGCFYGAYSICEIKVDKENKHFKAIDNILYSYDLKTLIKYPPKKENEFFEIPSPVNRIGKFSFQSNNHLKCLKIGKSVTHIESYAFFCYWNLKHVYIDESVTQIDDDMIFSVEDELRSYICNTGLVVGTQKGSATEKLFAPTLVGVFGIEDNEIDDFLSTDKPYFSHSRNDPYEKRCDFAIFDDTLVRYKGRDEEITIPDTVKIIGTDAFDNRYSLKKIIIPNGVKEIEKSAFNYFEKLEDIYIPESVTKIDKEAFFHCNPPHFTVSENNPVFYSQDGKLYLKNN